jgi:ABC-type multidrug transport system ATPase subunit
MRISLIDAGKRFNREWIFRHLDMELSSSRKFAITGPNGSGKSTLLQVIGGILRPSEGLVDPKDDGKSIDQDSIFKNLSFCAPYLELIEEMTGQEFLQFHASFKPFIDALKVPDILEATGLAAAAGKQIRYYSSGMKQRLKLAQAIFSDTSILLLDEPCTNLDKTGITLYRKLMESHTADRLVVISSNYDVEYDFCDEILRPEEWKKL